MPASSATDGGSFPSSKWKPYITHTKNRALVCIWIQNSISDELQEALCVSVRQPPLQHLQEEFSIVYCSLGWKVPLTSFRDTRKNSSFWKFQGNYTVAQTALLITPNCDSFTTRLPVRTAFLKTWMELKVCITRRTWTTQLLDIRVYEDLIEISNSYY